MSTRRDRRGATEPRPRREYHSVAQEAERLGVSPSWIYTECRADRFPCFHMNGRILLDPDEVDRYCELRHVTVEDALRQAEDDD